MFKTSNGIRKAHTPLHKIHLIGVLFTSLAMKKKLNKSKKADEEIGNFMGLNKNNQTLEKKTKDAI